MFPHIFTRYDSSRTVLLNTMSKRRPLSESRRKPRLKCQILIVLIMLMISAIVFFESKLSQFQKFEKIPNGLIQRYERTHKKINISRLNYLERYPQYFKCKNVYNMWYRTNQTDSDDFDYSQPAPVELHEKRITRAMVINFPIASLDHYVYEIKWLYRSWTHMMRFEPAKWRTDLVIFVERDAELFERSNFFLNELNCRFENVRRSVSDRPMCALVYYRSFRRRNFPTQDENESFESKYRRLLEYVNVFETNLDEFEKLYKLMKTELNDYAYLDSILVGFEGYFYFYLSFF